MQIISTSFFEDFTHLLNRKPETLITIHYNPDGDAVGVSLALYWFLKAHQIHAAILSPNELPDFLMWMPGADKIVCYNKDENYGNTLLENAELVFCLDFNAFYRVRLFEEQLTNSKATKVLIDHHIQPDVTCFDLYYSDTETSSTSELFFQIMQEVDTKGVITKEIAECVFVGIMTDTGSFSYSCNRADTFKAVAYLIDLGLDVEKIHRKVYDTYSESRMRLLGHCLSTNLKVIPEYATAYIWLSSKELEEFDYQQGDTEGVVNYALSIQNVGLAALFTERNDRIRVSLRSKGDFSVNEMARKHIKGGGHKNAAGGDIFLPLDEALKFFESLLPEYKEQIVESLINYQ